MKQNTISEVPKRLAVRIDQQSSSKVMAVSKDTINNLCFDSLAEEEKFSLLVKVTGMCPDRPVPLFVGIHEQGMELQPSTCYLTTAIVRKRKRPADTKPKGKLFSCMGQVKIDFCFSEPDTKYNIAFKIHSITDANGKEISGYRCKSDTCSVLTSEPQTYHSDPVRGSGLPLVKFSTPLVGKRYMLLTEKYTRFLPSGDFQTALTLTNAVTNSNIACDIKAVAYVFEGCAFMFNGQDEPLSKAMNAFSIALRYSNQIDC